MKILITTPSLKTPHGGTRVLNEWAAGLSQWHEVTLLVNSGDPVCNWYSLPPAIKVTKDKTEIQKADIVVIGSPHAIYLADNLRPNQKCFVFLQMLEHMFKPGDAKFQQKCKDTYLGKHPIICISKWNADYLRKLGRKGEIYYIGNGINLHDFPIEEGLQKDGKTILVEGWECTNQTKDTEAIAPRVAERFKQLGYKIIAYSQLPLTRYAHVPDEYYQQPSLAELNDLYRRATILLKASHYDARSTAPIEAMTKGTVTVRAIEQGDDDLIYTEEFDECDYANCIRTKYSLKEMFESAAFILTSKSNYTLLSYNCIEYVKKYNWDYWMHKINNLLCTKDLSAGAVKIM
jgi:hypothetical protein